MIIRNAAESDILAIANLYKLVAELPDGIARTPDEIDEKLITDFFYKSAKQGLMLVIRNPENPQELIAEIHCYKFDPYCFYPTLGNLTLVVHPEFQGRGFARAIFMELIKQVKIKFPEVLRIELFVRSYNHKNISFYEKLGFVTEGILKNRLVDSQGEVKDDRIMSLTDF